MQVPWFSVGWWEMRGMGVRGWMDLGGRERERREGEVWDFNIAELPCPFQIYRLTHWNSCY